MRRLYRVYFKAYYLFFAARAGLSNYARFHVAYFPHVCP